jgi:hypothetical protein
LLSLLWIPSVLILYADVSEHSAPSSYAVYCLHIIRRWKSVPKRRHIKFRRRVITQKKEYTILPFRHITLSDFLSLRRNSRN